MTCDFDPSEKLGINPRACTQDILERNFQNIIRYFDKLDQRLNDQFNCLNNALNGVSGSLKRFRLTSDLVFGVDDTEPNAVLLHRVGGAWVVDVEVVDDAEVPIPVLVRDKSSSPFFSGLVGYEGWCVPDDGIDDTYVIVDMEYIARMIEYTLTLDLTGGSAPATVDVYHDGKNPGSTVTVYDSTGRFKEWHRYGCHGKAFWSPQNNRYEIYDAQFVCRSAKAKLDPGICDDVDPENRPIIRIQEWIRHGNHTAAWQHYIKTSVDPDPEVFEWQEQTEFELYENWCSHRGTATPNVLVEASLHFEDEEVEGDQTEIRWNVYDMLLKNKKFAYDTEWSAGSCLLSLDRQEVWGEWCGDGDVIPVNLPFTTVTLPETFTPIFNWNGGVNPVCKVIANTGIYCAIRKDDGLPIDVIEFTPRIYNNDWYLQNDALNPLLDPAEWNIYVGEEVAFVACWHSLPGRKVYELERAVYVNDFDQVDTTDEEAAEDRICKVDAERFAVWGFEIENETNVNVLTMLEVENVIDVGVSMDETTLDKTTQLQWTLCKQPGSVTPIADLDDCP